VREPAGNRTTLILGLGNPLSGDDGFGVRVVELLSQNLTGLPPGTLVEDAGTDLLNRLEDFARFSRVVLIDAVLDSPARLGPPGRIALFREEEILAWPEDSPGAHQITPLLAIKLFRVLCPEERTRFSLIGLLVDRITQDRRYATEAAIRAAADAVLSILGVGSL